MTQKRVNDLLMEQWFRLHKTPAEQWKKECDQLRQFATLDEFLSSICLEHFGEELKIIAKRKGIRSRVLRLFRPKNLKQNPE